MRGTSFLARAAGCLKRKILKTGEEVKPRCLESRILPDRLATFWSQSAVEKGRMHGESKWEGRKQGRNEWRGEGRERAEGKSVTRLFLVVWVVTGGEKCWNVSSLFLPCLPWLFFFFPPKPSLFPNMTNLRVPKTSEDRKSPKYLGNQAKAVCGGNWGNNVNNRSRESFILVATDAGQEMFF